MPQENPFGGHAFGDAPFGPAPEDAASFTGSPVACRTITLAALDNSLILEAAAEITPPALVRTIIPDASAALTVTAPDRTIIVVC